MRRRKYTTPLELEIGRTFENLERTARMDRELSKYGRKVPMGMVWTVSDLQRFFRDKLRKKKR